MKIIGLLLGICIFLSGCKPEQEKTKRIVASKGLPYELLVVVDEQIWNSNIRDSVNAVAECEMPALPQSENVFRVIRITPQNFTRMYVTMRNILMISINPELDKAKAGVAYNVEASPQIYIRVEAPDVASMGNFLSENKEFIINTFVNSELTLEAKRLDKKYNKDIDDASQKIFGYSIHVPYEVAALKKGDDFLWASTDRLDQDMNYVCYTIPMMSAENLEKDNLWVQKRDSAMQKNIPGSRPDQWMTTTKEKDIPLVEYNTVDINGKKLCEMRGLWEMKNGGIGGPFVSVAYPDSLSGKIYVTEAFIYSPKSNKRESVRLMEAALRTFRKINTDK